MLAGGLFWRDGILTCEVWLHALKRVDEQALALEVNRSVLGHDAALNLTSRPELVVQPSPWMCRISSKCACPILAHHEAWRDLSELQVHIRTLVRSRLDNIALSVLAQIHRASISLEALLVLGEVEVVEIV